MSETDDPPGAIAVRPASARTNWRRRPSSPTLLFGLFWVACATFLQLERSPGVPPWDTLWQEDGGIFLTDALHHHLSSALFRPYNGYLHLVPRLLAALAVHLPLRDAAWIFAVSSALIVALVSVYVWWAARTLIPALWARNMLTILIVLAPVAAYETANNINNLHWYLLFALTFLPFSQPQTRWGVGMNVLIAVCAVLSDADALLLVPLFVPASYRAVRAKRWSELLLPVVVGACLLIQFTVGARGQSPGHYDPSHVADLPPIYALRVAGSFLIGDKYLPKLYDNYGLTFAYLCLLGLVVLLVTAVTLSRRWVLLITSVVGSCVFLGLPLMLRGTGFFLDRPNNNLNGSRYALLPVLFLATGLLGAAGTRVPTLLTRQLTVNVAPAVICLLVGTVVIYNYSDFNVRTPGPSWQAALSTAAAACSKSHDHPDEHGDSAEGNASGTMTQPSDILIPVAPLLPDVIPFAVVIGCAELDRAVTP